MAAECSCSYVFILLYTLLEDGINFIIPSYAVVFCYFQGGHDEVVFKTRRFAITLH